MRSSSVLYEQFFLLLSLTLSLFLLFVSSADRQWYITNSSFSSSFDHFYFALLKKKNTFYLIQFKIIHFLLSHTNELSTDTLNWPLLRLIFFILHHASQNSEKEYLKFTENEDEDETRREGNITYKKTESIAIEKLRLCSAIFYSNFFPHSFFVYSTDFVSELWFLIHFRFNFVHAQQANNEKNNTKITVQKTKAVTMSQNSK